MYIGVDVGGTFTDGVVVENTQVKYAVKAPTREDLACSLEQVLEQLLAQVDPAGIDRVVLSTTLVTNLLAQQKQKRAGLLLLPGPGVNPSAPVFVAEQHTLKGAIDYKGRLIEDIDLTEVQAAVESLLDQGIELIGVACKFAQRNPVLEERIVEYIKANYRQATALASHTVSGLLNWVRRANAIAFHLMVSGEYRSFIEQIKQSLATKKMACPIHPQSRRRHAHPEIALRYPLEAAFSGPAASALGALAAHGQDATCVVMDIGGTTTDLALLLNGAPLLSDRGAVLHGFPIPGKALAVASIALGGDTPVLAGEGRPVLGKRQGPAFCLGGPALTVTDILVYRGLSDIGAKQQVLPPLENIARQLGRTPDELAEEVLDIFIKSLDLNLEEMFKTWEEEPAYRVWQVVSSQKIRPNKLVCLGGPALGLGALWGMKKKWEVSVPPYAGVANAVGAALAKPTLRLDLLVDTEQMTYSTNIGTLRGRLGENIKNTDQARDFAVSLFRKTLEEWQVKDKEYEVLYEEGFNIVRGWHTAGRIFQVGLQTAPGLEYYLDNAAPVPPRVIAVNGAVVPDDPEKARRQFLAGGEDNA